MIGIKNIFAVLVVVAILALAITFLILQKKKGSKCIGCPYGSNCNQKSCAQSNNSNYINNNNKQQ